MKEIKITPSGIKQAIDNLLNENELLQDKIYKQEDEIERLNNIINKAIEYIENYLCSDEYIQSDINSIANAFVKLIDILKGVDKE